MFDWFKSKTVCPNCVGELNEKIPNDAVIKLCKKCAPTHEYVMFKDISTNRVFAVVAIKKIKARAV